MTELPKKMYDVRKDLEEVQLERAKGFYLEDRPIVEKKDSPYKMIPTVEGVEATPKKSMTTHVDYHHVLAHSSKTNLWTLALSSLSETYVDGVIETYTEVTRIPYPDVSWHKAKTTIEIEVPL